MKPAIHPSAVVDSGAELDAGVEVGAHAVVGPGVEIGEGTSVGAAAHVLGPARIGARNRIFPHACLGFEPQDLKYAGEPTRLVVGDDNQFREFSTVHRGTVKGGGVTAIGSGGLFMAYSHVAHDCRVGDRVIFANGATLAGHVEVGDDATISAFSSVHQFCRVGRHGYVGGYSVIVQDALPFVKTVGVKPACYGLNRIGLERKGVPAETIAALDRALRLFLRSGLNTTQAVERMRAEHGGVPEVEQLIAFIESARRGVIKGLPGRRGARGGAPD